MRVNKKKKITGEHAGILYARVREKNMSINIW